MADDDDDRSRTDHEDDRPGADHARDDKLLVLPLGEESKLITQTIANDTARQILELLADGAMSTSAIAKKLDIPLTTAQYNVEKLIEAKLVVVEKTKYSEKGREVKLYAPAKRMIVLVPANTPRQAVMDVLRKYLVLIPVAGFVALMVELAMAFLNGNMSGTLASREGDQTPLMSAAGNNLTATGATDSYNAAPGYAPASMPNITADGSSMKSVGEISGYVTTQNASVGLGPTNDWMLPSPPNGTGLMGNQGGPGIYMPEANRSALTGPDMSSVAPQPTGELPASAHGLIPPDLLNHYGLWFFIGCLLIIGVMITYELYRGRKKKK